MTQKIVGGRQEEGQPDSDIAKVRIDQVILARSSSALLNQVLDPSLKRFAVEVAVAYEGQCLSLGDGASHVASGAVVPRALLNKGLQIARPGIGFAAAVHLERFGSPARLALTDDPRLCAVGGAGTLVLLAAPHQLAEALATGWATIRVPRSVQVLLAGKLRPFVGVRDVALELERQGLGDVVRRIEVETGAPVVLEFSGPSVRLLPVHDRALLAGVAPHIGAAGALFISDEKTEVFLRDQRRSKAHRGLSPDPGAPSDAAITLDLSTLDPLARDEKGRVVTVRELQGRTVQQVILGGDTGASLRELLAVATLLKSKRVPAGLDLLVAPSSRQAMEVLARSGALVDLIATGARLIEPDARLLTGEAYGCAPDETSLRTFETDLSPVGSAPILASPETAAQTVTTGVIGDPRAFKRPVRVNLPRVLPTDDVLLLRKAKPRAKGDPELAAASDVAAPARPKWQSQNTLSPAAHPRSDRSPTLLVAPSLSAAMEVGRRAPDLGIWALAAPRVPQALAGALAAQGVVALEFGAEALSALNQSESVMLLLPQDGADTQVTVRTADREWVGRWPAVGAERTWLAAPPDISRPPPKRPRGTGAKDPVSANSND